MTLPSKTLDQLVNDQVATWGAQTGITPVLSSGDLLLAIFQANGTQLDYLQALIALLVKLTRASTSTGADLDSWMADFGFPREPASLALGNETLGKNSAATSAVTVFPGSLVQTVGGTVQYQIIADTNQAAWVADAQINQDGSVTGGYVLQAGQTSMTVTIQALTPGSAANVIAGALSQQGSQIPGIDYVTNPAAIVNGAPAESDAAYRARFVLYMQTLAKGTQAAILTAIAAVRQGLQSTLLENTSPSGATQLGAFTAIIDDGSGSPPAALLNDVADAIEEVRAFTIQPYIVAPTLAQLTIVLNVRPAAGSSAGAVTSAAQAAVVAFINSLTDGESCYISQVEDAAEAVTGVVSTEPAFTTIDGAQADFVVTPFQRVQTNAALVTVGTY